MKKIYSDSIDWNKKNWKNSFENLVNDGYIFDKIKRHNWFDEAAWITAVLCNTTAHKIIKETEKAIQFSVVNQYGNVYEMWFPKAALISY